MKAIDLAMAQIEKQGDAGEPDASYLAAKQDAVRLLASLKQAA